MSFLTEETTTCLGPELSGLWETWAEDRKKLNEALVKLVEVSILLGRADAYAKAGLQSHELDVLARLEKSMDEVEIKSQPLRRIVKGAALEGLRGNDGRPEY